MSKLRPDFVEYKDKVVDLLEDYGYSHVIKPFGMNTVLEITKSHIKESFLFQESVHRCAIGIMAVLMDASKQLAEINNKLKTDDILSSVDIKGTIQ